MNKELRFLLGTCVLPLISFAIAAFFYFYGFKIVNMIDTKSYYLSATNGKYDKEIFFSKSVNDETKIVDDTLNEIIEETESKITRKIDIFGAIANNANLSKKIISKNKKFMDYLNKQNLGIDDVINYCQRMYDVDSSMLKAGFYLAFTICILIDLFFLKHRKRIYGVALLVYLFSNLDVFTGSLSSQTIYHLPFIAKDLTHEEFQLYLTTMLPALKEAFLTFIILDTIYQTKLQDKNDSILRCEYNILKDEIKIIKQQATKEIDRFGTEWNSFKERIIEISNSIIGYQGKLNNMDFNIEHLNNTVDEYCKYIEQTAASAESIEKLLNDNKALIYFDTQKVDEINKSYKEDKASEVNKCEDKIKLIDNKTKQLEQIIENTRVVDKINELSESMLEITKQTRMLALTASIETSKISDSRNGFNFISKEMKRLAEQSKDNAIEIQNVATKASKAVDNLSNFSLELSNLIADVLLLNKAD